MDNQRPLGSKQTPVIRFWLKRTADIHLGVQTDNSLFGT